jgi:hypothetical protein
MLAIEVPNSKTINKGEKREEKFTLTNTYPNTHIDRFGETEEDNHEET